MNAIRKRVGFWHWLWNNRLKKEQIKGFIENYGWAFRFFGTIVGAALLLMLGFFFRGFGFLITVSTEIAGIISAFLLLSYAFYYLEEDC